MADPKSKAETKAREPVVFRREDLQDFAQTSLVWRAFAPKGMVVADLEKPSTWLSRLGSDGLHAGDVVHVISASDGWWAEVLIGDATTGACTPIVLRDRKLPPSLMADLTTLPAGYELFRANDGRYGVQNIETKDQLIEPIHFDPKQAAREAVDHARFRQPA